MIPCFNTQLDNNMFSFDSNIYDDITEIGYENSLCDLYDLPTEEAFMENSYTSDEAFDDDLSLMNGSVGMYDILKFSNSEKDRIEPADRMFSQFENIAAYRRKLELGLDDVIMKEKIIRTQSNMNDWEPKNKGRSRLYFPGGALLVLPNGNIHVTPPCVVPSVPAIDVRVPSGYPSPVPLSQRQGVIDQTLKHQWCSPRKSAGYRANSDMRWTKSSSVHNPIVRRKSGMDSWPPMHLVDDEFTPLLKKTFIKVRNVHPTACLHELHVQQRELFPMKPTFTTTKFCKGNQNKGNFGIVCSFQFNGMNMYTYNKEQTKSDAKMNASRSMLRKLKAIQNLTILLDDEKSGLSSTLEHPRCQLLHLHDTHPEMYPISPFFQVDLQRGLPLSLNKPKTISMTCHFQVGKEKLTTTGTASSKKQAIVQAARYMLKQLFPNAANAVDSDGKRRQTALDQKNTPWKCHFCNIFMTGRKPFLSHLNGRSHTQKMSQLELNAEEENKKLHVAAEAACEKLEEEKATLRNRTQEVDSPLQSNKNEEFFHHSNVMNTSSIDSQGSDVITKTITSSSENCEDETNYYLPKCVSN